jgi:hypothetical protein
MDRTGDPKVDEIIRRLEEADRRNGAIPILRGRLLEGIILNNGTPTMVAHGLKRPWRGWLVCNLEGATSTGRIQHAAPTPTDSYDQFSFLRLTATGYGGKITVSLWVF